MFDVDGGLNATVEVSVCGDNSQHEIIINADNISIMKVNLTGSGAVDDLIFIPGFDEEYVDDGKGERY